MLKRKEAKRSKKNEEIKEADDEKMDVNGNNDEISIKVGDIMTTNVIAAKPSDTITHVAKLMYDNRIEAVVIIRDDKNKNRSGIVTSKDIIYKIVAKGKNPKDVKIKDIMTGGIVTICPNNTIEDAAKLMRKYDIRRLPVINEKKEIIGIITESDIVRISPELYVLISEGARIRDYSYRE